MTLLRMDIYQPSDPPAHGHPLDVDDNDDIAGNRLPRLIVGALLGVAALTTLVWFAYVRSMGGTSSEIVVIRPPPGPVRSRPEGAGGEIQRYRGLKVYEEPQRAEKEAQLSRLATISSGEAGMSSANPSGGVPLQSGTAVAPGSLTPEFLQIGSYPSHELAETAFHNFQIAHGDLAVVSLPDIKKADLGQKGVWYRLRIGPYAGMTAAAEACEKMKKEGLTCLVTAR